MSNEQPKIIIDSDWKSQAQAEKERLTEKTAAAQPKAGPAGAPGAEEPVSFEEIVRMFAIRSLSYLGEVPDPSTGQRVFAPEYARFYIDSLGVLEEKTKGNLTAEESAMLTEVVRDLRMSYIELTKAVAQAVKEGKIKPQGGPGGMSGGVGGVAASGSGSVPKPTDPMGGIKLS